MADGRKKENHERSMRGHGVTLMWVHGALTF